MHVAGTKPPPAPQAKQRTPTPRGTHKTAIFLLQITLARSTQIHVFPRRRPGGAPCFSVSNRASGFLRLCARTPRFHFRKRRCGCDGGREFHVSCFGPQRREPKSLYLVVKGCTKARERDRLATGCLHRLLFSLSLGRMAHATNLSRSSLAILR